MTNESFTTKIEALAALVSAETKARLAAKYSQWQADAVKITVKPGAKYVKIDRDSSGMLMVEIATGNVYGIKGYGQVHKGHQNGTLDTVSDFYWGDYYPREATQEERDARTPVTEPVDTTPAPRNFPAFEVGDGATRHIGTDAQAFTVVEVSASGKTVKLQGDIATLDPDFTPDFSPGGFCGHVSNQNQQTWTYERNTSAPLLTARLTQRGWEANGCPVSAGRRAFHDYNF